MSTEMEEDCEVFMDPEEDEIFFGQISDKEMTVSPIIKNSEPASHDNKIDVNIENCNENDSKENNSDSLNKYDEIKENILKEKIMEQNINLIHEKNCLDDNLAQIKQKNLCENPAIKIESSAENMCKGILEDIIEKINNEKTITINAPSTPQIKKEGINQSSPNIQLDHNYSTPVKSVIDKSILATPKSVVKADKDGGFLKVLSEIALVKAEADIEKSLNKEDEDKENKNVNISLKVPEVKITEPTPDKSVKSPSPRKFIQETKKFKLVYNTPEKIESVVGEHLAKAFSTPTLPEIEETKKKEINVQLQSSGEVIVKFEDDELLKKNLEEFENQIKKEIKTEVTEFVQVPENDSSKIIKINLEEKVIVKTDVPEIIDLINSSSENVDYENDKGKESLNEKSDTKKIILDSLVNNLKEKDEKHEEINLSSNSDIQILDNTLEEKMLHDKSSNIRMSEEARKVVEILHNKAEDDSFNLTIQEIDVDKTHIPFDSPEISGLLNDSLPKASNNKQSELLRELLTATTPNHFKTPISAKVPSGKKILVSGEKPRFPTPLITKKTPIVEVKTSTYNSAIKTGEKSKICTPSLSEKKAANGVNVRWNPIEKSGSVKKCVKRLNVDEFASKSEEVKTGAPSREKETKAPGTSKIPKFGQFSKIPVSGKKIVFQPTSKNTPAKTPTVKTPKSSAYSKIESPVNAYIHNKPTPLIKNIKPEVKKDSGKKVWMRQAVGSAKKVNNEEQVRKVEPVRCKVALPYIEYRSATPLKFEKPVESKLPRLAPTMKKLITANSPTVLRHEGRIHLNLPRKVPVSAIDNSVMADPNEVSVVVSHVAQKTNTISK